MLEQSQLNVIKQTINKSFPELFIVETTEIFPNIVTFIGIEKNIRYCGRAILKHGQWVISKLFKSKYQIGPDKDTYINNYI